MGVATPGLLVRSDDVDRGRVAFEEIVDSGLQVLEVQTAGAGPQGRLPITAEMLPGRNTTVFYFRRPTEAQAGATVWSETKPESPVESPAT